MSTPIRVLVVDDSAFVRKVVREMLTRAGDIDVVGTARDGEEALELVDSLRPDVVTCDLNMPRLDGVGFVRRQMSRRPIPILILTASPQDASLLLEALTAGAVDFVQKPTALATDQLFGVKDELVSKIFAAAGAPVNILVASAPAASERPITPHTSKVDAVVLGISTGGPQALRQLLPQLPADFPVPLAIVLHMPVGYTALFAEKLNEITKIRVAEAKDGDIMRPGVALLAQAGRHLTLSRSAQGDVVARLTIQPFEKIHRPSVDVLFESASAAYRDRLLAVVMTGMGDDGAQGCAWVKAQGGIVITEAEKSCIIYGMPRSVVEAGLSDAAVPLDQMAYQIMERV